ncbi:MAG: hypothetical protein JWO02_1714, partial [Solirubrobacterales bacterium]|nr:hypothetical protein [Solirubrobacterales bacterium]
MSTPQSTITLPAGQAITDVAGFLREHRLLTPDADGLVRLPILVAGRLVIPAELAAGDAHAAIGSAAYAEVGEVQVIRQARIDPLTLREDGHLLFLIPRIGDPRDICAVGPDAVARRLATLPSVDVARYLDRVGDALAPHTPLHAAMREL